MANKKVTLADRINNPDRMSRAVNIHLTSLPVEEVKSEENLDVNLEEKELIGDNNIIIDETNNLDNAINLKKTLIKPLEKPLGFSNNNNLNNDIINNLDKVNDNVINNDLEKGLNNNFSKENINNNTNVNTKSSIISKHKPNAKNNPESLTELIKQKVAEIERVQREELAPISFTKKKEKIKFDDKNPIISFPARPEIDEIINIINCKTGVKKYKIFELLILEGLRHTEFE